MKHRIKTTHLLALLLVAILAACQVVDGTPTMTPPATIPPTKDHRTPPPDDPLVALGMTHLTGLEISGAETDAL
ncbi:MAG: hypothetical protein GWN12_08725, partial [Thermoplasmata archaeon]|nr:hypothetical protein [Thermoplasmata archaeon]NIT77236.1 hypothetical protein [Thermoplasmata archaeon]NIV35939.1 hypothetical protein [Anaerolineae bacterium]NIW88850.1 hypothetical protein [Thermoplasmata archaeon]NIY03607.1 hypothetical protein [Thermoplasmata archaeon]